MSCPFLSRLPGSFIKNYATPLLKMYADQCPVISRAVSVNKGPHYHQEFAAAFKSAGHNPEQINSGKPDVDDISMKCPFLKDLGQDGTKQLIKPSREPEIFEESSKGKYLFRRNHIHLRVILLYLKPIVPNIIILLSGGFYDYNNFFTEQIMKKKLDHSYRVFKKVNRSAENFPTAKEYSWGEKNINVWCSNDYLGMSAHPKVKAAVR